MSLDFNFEDMIERLGREEFDRITDHPTEAGKWHPVTDQMIWACMSVGIGKITEATVEKFIERYAALQALNSGDMIGKDGRFYITGADVRNHIGLRTNVSDETDAAFAEKLFRIAKEEGLTGMNRQRISAFDNCARLVKEAAGNKEEA